MSVVYEDLMRTTTEAIGSDSSGLFANETTDTDSEIRGVSEPRLIEEWEKNLVSSIENADDLAATDGSVILPMTMAGLITETNPFSNVFYEYSENNSMAIPDVKPTETRVIVDTAAPIDSVQEVVTKYGGIIDWKVHRDQTMERRKHIHKEFEEAIEELPKYKDQSESAEVDMKEVLEELDRTKRMAEELKHSLERAEMEEAQARQDYKLAQLQKKEKEEVIANIAAAKAQLVAVKETHTTAVAELLSVTQELEEMKREYASLAYEKDEAIRQAGDSISLSQETEKTVQDLKLELIATKALLESAQTEYLEAEERRINSLVVSSEEGEVLELEYELEKAEAELRQLSEQHLMINDLKAKNDAASETLAGLKAEMNSHIETLLNQDELEDVTRRIEKSKEAVNSLRTAVSLLKSELESEKETIGILRERGGSAPTSVSALEEELNQMNNELAEIDMRQEAAREKGFELPRLVQEAADEADRANSVANSAQEELKIASEESEKVKDGVYILESRLRATLREIEATVASSELTMSSVKALEGAEQSRVEPDSQSGVKLTVQQYSSMRNKAGEAESEEATASVEQLKFAKESEAECLRQLEEAKNKLEAKRRQLKATVEIEESAKEGKLEMEQELRRWREEHGRRRKANDSVQMNANANVVNSSSHFSRVAGEQPRNYGSSRPSLKMRFSRLGTVIGAHSCYSAAEPKRSKRSVLPRVVTFLARKKAQTLK